LSILLNLSYLCKFKHCVLKRKRFVKILLYLLLAFFIISATSIILLLKSSHFQSWITQKIANAIVGDSNVKIQIESVDIEFFNKLVLNNIYIEDANSDTLFYINKLKAGIKEWDSDKQELFLNSIEIDKSFTNLLVDSNDFLNIHNLTALFSSDSTNKDSSVWKIYSKNINITNSRFVYNSFFKEKKTYGMNYWDLDIKNINLSISDIKIINDSMLFNIDSLSCTEKCGFELDNFAGNINVCPTAVDVKNLKILTPKSNISAKVYSMKYNYYKAFLNYISDVKMLADFNYSQINSDDIAYFAYQLKNAKIKTDIISGKYTGTVDNFKLDNLKLKYGRKSMLVGSCNINGLPDINNTFMFITVDSLKTKRTDLETIKIPPYKNNNFIKLPKQIANMGTIIYRGNFTGLYNDFVSYGKFYTDAGVISTDILLKNEVNSNKAKLNGEFSTYSINLDKILETNAKIGDINISAKLDGYISPDSIVAKLNGNIDKLAVLNYHYKNINIDGTIKNKEFEGLFEVNDSNLVMDFLGVMNFDSKNPRYDFTADIKYADLYKLNIYKSDTLATVSAKMVSQFTGNDIDKMNGRINIFDFNFANSVNNINIHEFSFISHKTEEYMRVNIFSDFVEAEIIGQYRLVTLINTLKKMSNNYYPSLFEFNQEQADEFNNNFTYLIKLKDNKDILSFFIKNSEIKTGSTIFGKIDQENNKFITKGIFKSLTLNNVEFSKLNFILDTENDSLIFKLNSKKIKLNNNYEITDYKTSIKTKDNVSDFQMFWDSESGFRNSGDIFSQIRFSKNKKTNNNIMDIDFIPSYFVVNDTIWYLNNFSSRIDTSSIVINKLVINNEDQFLFVNGKISKNEKDTLSCYIHDISLNNIVNMLGVNINLKGNISGDVSLSDAYNKFYLNTVLDIENLVFNDEKFGHGKIESKYIKKAQSLAINFKNTNTSFNIINLKGNYYLKSKAIDFKLNLNKIKSDIAERYSKVLFNNFHGVVNADIDISGKIDKPIFEGFLVTKRVSMKLNYLETNYNFNDTVWLKKDGFIFNDFRFDDNIKGHYGLVNGAITHNNFKDFKIDLSIKLNNLKALNTKANDNNMFYGLAFADGIVDIKGTPDNIKIVSSVKTKKNTKIMFPLSTPDEVDDNNYVQFVNTDTKNKDKQQYKVDLSGIEMLLNIDVTPDAKVELIFDEKTGDIIKGNGTGDLELKIDKQGSFFINGEYFINRGNYLFTLRNVINKKFVLESGSSIKWTGDIYSAQINANAVYKLKASPYNLTLDPEDKPRIPVECKLNLTKNLMNPNIKFGLNMPNTSDRITNVLSSMSEDELNRQIIYLLVTSNFYTNPDLVSGTDQPVAGNAFGNTTSELLSNQLSNWLSQISDDFDIGVNYHPGDEISSDEVELALSTQIFNDRVIVSGNLGIGEYQTKNSESSVAGDFDVEVKVNKKGNLRLRGFNRVNDNVTYKNSLYTQGVGVYFKEDFISFKELKKKYLAVLKRELKKSYNK